MVSETNGQVAMLHHAFVSRGWHERFVVSRLLPSTSTPALVTVLRQQFGALLMRAGRCLQSGQTSARESLGVVATGEPAAIA